jgi:hypothetical protein
LRVVVLPKEVQIIQKKIVKTVKASPLANSIKNKIKKISILMESKDRRVNKNK